MGVLKAWIRAAGRALVIFALVPCAAAVAAGAAPVSGAASAGGVEAARERLRVLEAEAARIDEWVEENWQAEFAERYPGLSREPRRPGESESEFRARDLRARLAASELRKALRAERAGWLEREKQALLSAEIADELPVRLGPYDAERGEYPLLLGFGWPASLSIRFRVPERDAAAFAASFPKTLRATFRINEKGEVLLTSLERGAVTAEAVTFVAAPGPRLLWQGSHESWVTAVCFDSDGSRIVSAGGDGAISAWDAETGHRLMRLTDVEMALSLAFAPDGASFATGGADGYVRLRDGRDGREIWRAQASGMVFSTAFSKDGRFIASGDDGGSLRLWNAASGKEILRAELGAPVRAVAFAGEGRTIAAGTEGAAVVLWDTAANRLLRRIETDGPVYAVAAARGLVAAAGAGPTIRVLRESDGGELFRRQANGEIRSLQFDRMGRLLGSGGSAYTVLVMSAETGEPLWSASVGSPVRSLAFGPAGVKLAVGSADFHVRLFEVDEGDRVVAAVASIGRIFVERGRARSLLR